MITGNRSTPDFSMFVRVFARIGCLSFGGPAGQIALMHRELIEERQWLNEQDYLLALNFCHLLPGPEAQQLATWIGWKLHGIRGGLAAGLLFVMPGALVILFLSIFYAYASQLGWFGALTLGIKAAVLAIVVQALVRIGGRALDTAFKKGLALSAFVALFLFNLPFPVIVLGAAAIGIVVARRRPDWLALKISAVVAPQGPKPWAATFATVAIWGLIWAAPMITIYVFLGADHVLWDIGSFFSRLAVVTFGGAYAVLAYMAQEAVQGFNWLSAGEMADGLGLAETTPGPLIMVTQFVGYLAAFREPEPFSPLVAGLFGAGLTTWVTFAPCFLWIFAFAPWIERLNSATGLKGGLAALTAAIVGAIANLTFWFALHVVFTSSNNVRVGPISVISPVWTSFDWQAAILGILTAILLFRYKWSVIAALGLSVITSMILHYISISSLGLAGGIGL